MKRKATSKRLRFEVFKRDGFLCRYCGKQPPEVVLEIDHIEPVVDGGVTEELNLVTACAACNGGKAAVPLSRICVAPDADALRLEYLETQQEIAEARRCLEAKRELRDLRAEFAEQLSGQFCEDPGFYVPAIADQIGFMLSKHDASVVAEAVEDVARKIRSGYLNVGRSDYRRNQVVVKYLWGILRRVAEEGGAVSL